MTNGDLLVRNLSSKGKKAISEIEEVVENNLIFPAISGKEIDRWTIRNHFFVLIVQDPEKRIGYPEYIIKQKYPRTYGYLLKFKEELLNRAAYKKYHADKESPFYSQFNIGAYTFSNFKVVWKRMANDIVAAVICELKTPFGYKKVFPMDTTVFFPTDNESEAHYLCAIINSNLVRDFIKSFSSAGRGFGTPSVMEHVGIPKFDSKNELHQKLSEISKKCHQLKSEDKEKEIEKLENENNKLVMQLFSAKR